MAQKRAKSSQSSGASSWTRQLIEETQAEVLGLVNERRLTDSDEDLAAWLRQRIASLQAEDSPISRLRVFTYGIHLLVTVERSPGIKGPEIDRVTAVCLTALRVERIDPDRSQFAYLFGLLHSVLSQIHRRRGLHFQAAWAQCLAERQGRLDQNFLAAYMHYCVGNRALRLGYGSWADMEYQKADEANLPERWGFHFQLQRFTLERMRGSEKGAELRLAEAAKAANTEVRRREVEWLEIAWEAQRTHDLSKMAVACRRRGNHFRNVPVLEFALWCMSVPTTKWIERMPDIHNLRYDKELKLLRVPLLNEIASALQSFYSGESKLTTRLERLGEVLQNASELECVDHEALVWLAASRALIRSRSENFARLCRFRYQELSRNITDRHTDDCLGAGEGL